MELVDWLAAHRHAVRIVKQTVPFMPEGPDWRGWRIQVTDESRRHVLSVLFHAPSRHAASGLTQTCLQTNVPDLTAILEDAKPQAVNSTETIRAGARWVRHPNERCRKSAKARHTFA